MAEITHRHTQLAIIEQAVSAALSAVPSELARQQTLARTGSPSFSLNGRYNDDGEFETYMRLDVDAFNSGRGCAP